MPNLALSNIDVLIRGARVIDGTGNPWRYGDVLLAGERIVEIAPPGSVPTEQVKDVVDATGMVVCPGFIDILSHSTLTLMHDHRCLSKITQGVTTEIMGEGWTPAPYGGRAELGFIQRHPLAKLIPDWIERIPTWSRFHHWLDALMEHGVSSNVGAFVGGGLLRMYAKGFEMGTATDDEIETMRRVVAGAMEEGALGVSYALIYPPSAYSDTNEIVEVCKVVSQYNGIYVTHLRSEADAFHEGVDEALEIGRRANLPIEIYHLKAAGRRNWHKMAEVIEKINQARAAGVDITADIYPYPAMGTGLASVLPPWASADGQFYNNLSDPAMREKIKAEVLNPSGDWEAMAEMNGPEGIMPTGFHHPDHQQYAGMRLNEIAEARGQDWVETVFDLFLAEQQRINAIYFTMSEENVRLKLQQPWVTIGTDAGGLDPAWSEDALGPYHPRAYGSYPRILGKYVRDEGIIPLEEAIRKMSSAVANRLGIRQRGLLQKGYYADVVVFDPNTISDRATFEDGHQLSVGIRDVWVNGTRVLEDGVHTEAQAGQIVRK